MTEIELRTLPPRIVASVRDVIPHFADEGQLWERLMAGLTEAGATPAHGEPSYSVFHDHDPKEPGVDVEVQLTVTRSFKGSDTVQCVSVPRTQVALGTLYGPYDRIGHVVEEVARWVETHGHRFAGEMTNIYLVGPESGRPPAEWVTEVCLPVATAETKV